MGWQTSKLVAVTVGTDPLEVAAERCRMLADVVEANPSDTAAVTEWLAAVDRLIALAEALVWGSTGTVH